MFVAILILLILPFVDTSNIKGSSFKPLFIVAF
jgi:quinol-cytochrome oxidoreductase complex cytochrome b subunit